MSLRAVVLGCALIAACGDDGSSAKDAGADAVRRDAPSPQFCSLFPDDQVPNCPAAKKYCCFENENTTCVSEMLSASCAEHPAGAPVDCKITDGSGCPASQPICCSAGEPSSGTTYCSDHRLEGVIWMCSQ